MTSFFTNTRTQCFCGNNTNYSRYGTNGALCNLACPGNSAQNCGGTKSINIVKTTCVGEIDLTACNKKIAASGWKTRDQKLKR